MGKNTKKNTERNVQKNAEKNMVKFTCDEFLAQLKQITGQPYSLNTDCTVSLSPMFKGAVIRDFKEFPQRQPLGMKELKIYLTKNTERSFHDAIVNVNLTYSVPNSKARVKASYKSEKSDYEKELEWNRYLSMHHGKYYNYFSGISSEEPPPTPSGYRTQYMDVSMEVWPSFCLKTQCPLDFELKNGSKIFDHSDVSWQWWSLPSYTESEFMIVCPDRDGSLSIDARKPNTEVKLKVDGKKVVHDLLFDARGASAKMSDLECGEDIIDVALFMKNENGGYHNIGIKSVDGKSDYKVFKAKDVLKEALENIEKSK